MPITLSLLILIALFVILGFSADLVAKNLRAIAIKLGLPVFVLGLVLGLLTSTPEMSLAINAMIDEIQGLSIGNLMGGTVTLLSFVLGIGVILNKEISNDGRLPSLAIALSYLILPLILALDGGLGWIDGLTLIISYLALTVALYLRNQQMFNIRLAIINERRAARELMSATGGIAAIMVCSHFIVQITESLLQTYSLSPFLIGMIFFPLGTNLPEITLALASWRRKDKELSFSNILGSAMANSLMIGILVTVRYYGISQKYNFLVTLIALTVISIALLVFYRSGRKLSRKEGFILVALFVIFIIFQLLSDPLQL